MIQAFLTSLEPDGEQLLLATRHPEPAKLDERELERRFGLMPSTENPGTKFFRGRD
jgi:hypothetical protein